jgi:hypothetical protein
MGKNFLLLHVVQTGSGAHPASYPMGTKLTTHIQIVKETWIYTSTPPYVFMA